MKILVMWDFQGVFPQKLKNKIKKEEFDLIVTLGDYAGIKEWRPYIMFMFKQIKKKKEVPTIEEYFGKAKLKALEKKDFEAAKSVLKYLNSLGKKTPLLYIFGNTDDGWYNYPFDKKSQNPEKKKTNFLKKLKHLKNINYKSKKFKGINFIGFGGYMDIESYIKEKSFKALGKKNIKKIKSRLKKTKQKLFKLIKKTSKPRIFVFHYPPYGIFDVIKDKKNPMNRKRVGVKSFSQTIKKHKPLLVLCGHMHEYRGMKKLYGVPVINPGDAEKGRAAIITIPENKKEKVTVKFI